MRKFLQAGQIGLIVVLIMAVGLTIGLAVASQSLTDISITETEEQSLRAFNAAEAGIEATLRADLAEGITSIPVGADGLNADVTVANVEGQTITLNRNETTEVPITGGTATSVIISWVDKNDTIQYPGGNCNNPQEGEGLAPASIEVLRLRNESGSILPYRYLYNSFSCSSLDGTNGFDADSRPVVGGVAAPLLEEGETPFLSSVTFNDIDSNSGDGTYDIALRIRTFYNKATIKIEGAGLPVQQYQITSTATTPTGETRTIEVGKTVEAWPPIFDYVLFSGGQLSK